MADGEGKVWGRRGKGAKRRRGETAEGRKGERAKGRKGAFEDEDDDEYEDDLGVVARGGTKWTECTEWTEWRGDFGSSFRLREAMSGLRRVDGVAMADGNDGVMGCGFLECVRLENVRN